MHIYAAHIPMPLLLRLMRRYAQKASRQWSELLLLLHTLRRRFSDVRRYDIAKYQNSCSGDDAKISATP